MFSPADAAGDPWDGALNDDGFPRAASNVGFYGRPFRERMQEMISADRSSVGLPKRVRPVELE